MTLIMLITVCNVNDYNIELELSSPWEKETHNTGYIFTNVSSPKLRLRLINTDLGFL